MPAVAASRLVAVGVALLVALALAACGASTPSKPVAERVCGGAARAAGPDGPATVRILSREASNVVCDVAARRLRVQIVSQAVPQSYTEFDTESSHQSQVYGPAAPGVHNVGRTPFQVMVRGAVAAIWVPGQKELIATSGSPTQQGGAYVTVTVSHVSEAAAKSIALTVGRAVFAARPTQ